MTKYSDKAEALKEALDAAYGGNSPGTFADLQSLITSASNGDVITLDKDYKYDSTTDSSLTNGIAINKTITIIGNEHIIDGDNNVRAFFGQPGTAWELNNITIQNCTIENSNGGAIYLNNNNNLTINNCTFKNNNSTYSGGAICAEVDCILNITDCIFDSNTVEDGSGGALFINSSQLNIMESTIKNNTVEGEYSYGGGIYLSYTQANIIGNTIIGNKTNGSDYTSGAGIFIDWYSSAKIIGNNITKNIVNGTYGDGGGICNNSQQTIIIKDSIIKSNNAPSYANIYSYPNITINNCDIDNINTTCNNVTSKDYLTDHQTIPSASTSVAGTVQLEDSYSSTSTTKAPTSNALKTGLATKASSNHIHYGGDLASPMYGTLFADYDYDEAWTGSPAMATVFDKIAYNSDEDDVGFIDRDANEWKRFAGLSDIPSASSTTPSADTTNGSIGSTTTWAKADHTHPQSSLYATSNHTHNNYVQLSEYEIAKNVLGIDCDFEDINILDNGPQGYDAANADKGRVIAVYYNVGDYVYVRSDGMLYCVEQEEGFETIGKSRILNIKKSNDIVDLVYPVGSIYMSVNSTSPATLFGGTWEQLENQFLLGAGSSYTAGTTGGEATHTLNSDEMPSHTHIQNQHTHTQNGHSHNASQNSFVESNKALAIDGTLRAAPTASSGKYYWRSTSTGTGSIHQATASTTATNQNTTATNQNTGGGQAHNNMPPYLVVYMWKRTA